MKRLFFKSIFIIIIIVFLASCGNYQNSDGNNSNSEETTKLQVVSTFSILSDIVANIGGELIDVHNLVPIGTDPHEYTPLPLDLKKTADADIVFYNGLNLEEGDGWLPRLIENTNKGDEQVIKVTNGVKPKYLTGENGTEDEINPHAFLDVNVGKIMVKNIYNSLVKFDQANQKYYEKNKDNYLKQLKQIDKEYREKINRIKEERRYLVTSEHAYQYMVDTYGLTAGYLWAIDTDEQGTPIQITSLIKFVNDNEVPALFVESNVDPRPMETVSAETGVPIKGRLFSDELGHPGMAGDTYLKFLRHNLNEIYEHLK